MSQKKKKTSKKKAAKSEVVKAKIISYRRDHRLQTTNQAIAQVLGDYNHTALIGKQFSLEMPEKSVIRKGIVTAIHGQPRNKKIRIRFASGGMTAHAINKVIEIHI
ncbi:MAG: hypothetical protein GF308_17000 [Candidatus Heimdallarchaeota archaeon]|nr:hypothetical protein [Candidatus Heimdallarchaeota archaeon]